MSRSPAVIRVAIAIAAFASTALAQQRDTVTRRDTVAQRDTVPKRDTTDARDRIGDLNAVSVAGGVFPGSFMIPGTEVSLGIGGFVKVLAFHDSESDERSPDFVPADLAPEGTGGSTYAMTANLSRLFIDARASARRSDVRGYMEIDFNGPSVVKLRHAYLRFRTPYADVRAGQTWSTFTNVSARPDLLGEAATSGLAEIRQTQIRYTQHTSRTLHVSAAIENPSSSDVAGDVREARTPAPDVVVSVAYEDGALTRLQLAGVARRLEVVLQDGSTPAGNAWGAQLSVVLEPLPRHVVRAEGLVGDGIGRYLQGLDGSSAASVSPDGDLDTRRAWGASASYEYPWSTTLRSSIVAGTARARAPSYGSAATFERSDLLGVNLLWRVSRYTTVGAEYMYGQRHNVAAPSRHNHHVVIGMQLF